MSTKTIFHLALLLIGFRASAQTEPAEIRNMTKLSFLSPGVIYEARTGAHQSLRGHVFAGVGFAYSYSSTFGSNFEFDVNPGVGLQYRLYYNAKARAAKGKRTENNNQNYVAGFSQMILSKSLVSDTPNERAPNLRPITSLGAVWGIQRNYPKHFSLDLSFGPGVYFTYAEYDFGSMGITRETISNFTLVGELTLGFWLNSNRKK